MPFAETLAWLQSFGLSETMFGLHVDDQSQPSPRRSDQDPISPQLHGMIARRDDAPTPNQFFIIGTCPPRHARSHASMRLEFRSTGSGKNATSCANRLLVQQAATQHESRWGSPLSVLPRKEQLERPTKKSKTTGGSAFLEFRNHKLKTAKRLMAPHRALTVDEMNTIHEQTSKEWLQLTDDEVQEWQDIHTASKLQKNVDALAPIPGRAADNEEEPTSIQNLWGHREGPGHLVPATSIIDAFEKLSPSARRDLAIHDPALVISEKDAMHRLETDPSEGHAKLCSCWDAKKTCVLLLWMQSSKNAW